MLTLHDHANAVEFFGLQSLSPDMEKIFLVLGAFILASMVMPVLAIVWLIKGKSEGFVLSYIVGVIAFARGVLTLINFERHGIAGARLSVTPMIVGFIILMITFIAAKQRAIKSKNP